MRDFRISAVRAATLVLALGVAGAGWGMAEVKVEETVLAPADAHGVYHLSPAGLHVAGAVMQGSRWVVVYDGTTGPAFDEIKVLQPGGLMLGSGVVGARVMFSPDGSRWAYAGRQKDEWVVMVDGKELARVKAHEGATALIGMEFSPQGKHFVFISSARPDGWETRVYVDGQGGPLMARPDVHVVYSPDGERYAYVAAEEKDPQKRYVVVDGKRAGDTSMDPAFTASGKLIARDVHPDGTTSVLVEGKEVLKAAYVEPRVFVAPAGDGFAVLFKKSSDVHEKTLLWIDGKELDPGTNLGSVVFSPDGKRYAVVCGNGSGGGQTQWVVFDDGKRGQDYLAVNEAAFSADGKHFSYVGSNGGKYFANVDGKEYEGFDEVSSLSLNGDHFGFVGRRAGEYVAVVDGKTMGPTRRMIRPRSLMFSGDGSRQIYLADNVASPTPVVDGQDMTGVQVRDLAELPKDSKGVQTPAPLAIFSPDGKHLAFSGTMAPQNGGPVAQGVVVDGQLLKTPVNPGWLVFSAEGQHLVWTALLPPKTGTTMQPRVFVDGAEAVQYDRSTYDGLVAARRAEPDGSVTFIGVSGGSVKRFHVTPDPEMGFAKALAAQKAAEDKALADAAQAAADAKAAKEKAAAEAAQAKADAQAKRAADAEAKRQAKLDAQANAKAAAAAKRAAKP